MPQKKSQHRPPGGKRPNRAEQQRRLAEVEAMLATGVRRADIVSTMRTKFGVSERTVGSYIARVRDTWAAETKEASATDREATIVRLTKLSRRLEQERAWTALTSVERLLADIRGVRSRHIELHAEVNQHATPFDDVTYEQAVTALELLPSVLAEMINKGEVELTTGLVAEVKELNDAIEAREAAAKVVDTTHPDHVDGTPAAPSHGGDSLLNGHSFV